MSLKIFQGFVVKLYFVLFDCCIENFVFGDNF